MIGKLLKQLTGDKEKVEYVERNEYYYNTPTAKKRREEAELQDAIKDGRGWSHYNTPAAKMRRERDARKNATKITYRNNR